MLGFAYCKILWSSFVTFAKEVMFVFAWVCLWVCEFVCEFVNKKTQNLWTDFDEIFRIYLKSFCINEII